MLREVRWLRRFSTSCPRELPTARFDHIDTRGEHPRLSLVEERPLLRNAVASARAPVKVRGHPLRVVLELSWDRKERLGCCFRNVDALCAHS